MDLSKNRIRLMKYVSITFSFLIVLVLIFLGLAIILYPGGNFRDHSEMRYSFFFNTICDLRPLTAINGESNLLSSIFIKISTSMACIGMILFFSSVAIYFQENKIRKIISWIASTFGISFGPFYFAVIFIDTSHDYHMLIDTLSGLSVNIAVIMYTILYFSQHEFTRITRVSFLMLSIVSVSFSIIVAIGAILGGEFNIIAHRLGSNSFIIFTFLVFLVQGISIVNYLTTILHSNEIN